MKKVGSYQLPTFEKSSLTVLTGSTKTGKQLTGESTTDQQGNCQLFRMAHCMKAHTTNPTFRMTFHPTSQTENAFI
jgi:hypothetical protein